MEQKCACRPSHSRETDHESISEGVTCHSVEDETVGLAVIRLAAQSEERGEAGEPQGGPAAIQGPSPEAFPSHQEL